MEITKEIAERMMYLFGGEAKEGANGTWMLAITKNGAVLILDSSGWSIVEGGHLLSASTM